MSICLEYQRVPTQIVPNAINSKKLHTTYIRVFEGPAGPFTTDQRRKFPGKLKIKPLQFMYRTIPNFLKIPVFPT